MRSTRPIQTLRERPELLFLPIAAAFLLVNIGPWGYGLTFVVNFLSFFTLRQSNQIFPVTLSMAWFSFLLVLVVSYRSAHLSPLRAFIIAGTVPFAGAGAFELAYQLIGAQVQPCCFGQNGHPAFDGYAILSALLWVALGFTGLGFWKVTTKFWLLFLALAIGFAAWALLGYPQVTWGSVVQQPAAYAFNVALKCGMFLLFTLPLVEGLRAVATREERYG